MINGKKFKNFIEILGSSFWGEICVLKVVYLFLFNFHF